MCYPKVIKSQNTHDAERLSSRDGGVSKVVVLYVNRNHFQTDIFHVMYKMILFLVDVLLQPKFSFKIR